MSGELWRQAGAPPAQPASQVGAAGQWGTAGQVGGSRPSGSLCRPTAPHLVRTVDFIPCEGRSWKCVNPGSLFDLILENSGIAMDCREARVTVCFSASLSSRTHCLWVEAMDFLVL